MHFRFLLSLSIVAGALCVTRGASSFGVNGSNGTIFQYQDINQCKRNEFYDLDYFSCIACNADDAKLQPTENKLSCQCAGNTVTVALYDSNREGPTCENCGQNESSSITVNEGKNCNLSEGRNGSESHPFYCPLKYVNRTNEENIEDGGESGGVGQAIRINRMRTFNVSNCDCDLKFNFHYQDFCIANELLKPYLHYNSYWQPIRVRPNGNFGELKFVAFFCLRMRNSTACNQLANLCILSHYSFDKNSPCSAFLLTQASDVAFRYGASMDDQLRPMRPFLFFKKSQQTAELLREPVLNSSGYDLTNQNELHIFSTHHSLDGTLKRRGPFHFDYVNLCGTLARRNIKFGATFKPFECTLSLENLIDLAQAPSRSDFVSLFLNYSSNSAVKRTLMHSIPVFIEGLTPENQLDHQPSEWFLVKRFQMITAHPRSPLGLQKPIYEDRHKLQLYRSIRFASKLELHYKIHSLNRISIPILRLRYQNIEFQANTTLDQKIPFTLAVTFAIAEQNSPARRHRLLYEMVLPFLLLTVITISLLLAHNYRKRRRRSAILSNASEAPQAIPMEFCDLRTVLEFLLQLSSHLSHAMLICFLLHVIYDAMEFLTQSEVSVTLPLTENGEDNGTTLKILIYAALLLKSIFYLVHLWRSTHYDLFFVDWERPKSYDNNHFNLKSNLETSSVCSSVRTFVSESNVSAWRIFFTANEWIRLSTKRKVSTFVQGLGLLVLYEYFHFDAITKGDLILQFYVIIMLYIGIYIAQLVFHFIFVNYITGDPFKKFVDLCSWANISVFILRESSYGYYIHGRSPHGFADTDMSSMIMQLQRESQSMCGRRGLLSDSDQQTYIILPPINLRTYFRRLLIPFQRSYSISQAHYQKETISLGVSGAIDGNLERTFIAYSSINRFFCAFIDHAIKDMDYIIKEKTVLERILDCEFENYLTENKGTFYIDSANSFSQLFLYGNELHTFVLEFLLLLAIFMFSQSLILAIVVVCLFNATVQRIVSLWMRSNVSQKTLIDKRFLL